MRGWHALGYHVDVSVNISARQLETDTLIDDISRAVESSGFDARSLIVEITETAIMKSIVAVVPRLAALKATGVRVAIDDLGTGYSSLAYLQQLPIDALKIDRSFISTMADSPESGAMLRTLVRASVSKLWPKGSRRCHSMHSLLVNIATAVRDTCSHARSRRMPSTYSSPMGLLRTLTTPPCEPFLPVESYMCRNPAARRTGRSLSANRQRTGGCGRIEPEMISSEAAVGNPCEPTAGQQSSDTTGQVRMGIRYRCGRSGERSC